MLAAVALVLLVKLMTTATAAALTGVGMATAVSTSFLLAQIGEFAFVLERLGREEGLTPAGLGEDGSQSSIAATVLLLVATPGLAAAGRALSDRVTARRLAVAARADPVAPAPVDGHVLVSGRGAGRARRLDACPRADVVIGDDEPEQAARIAGVVAQVAPAAHLVVLSTDADAVPELHESGVATVVLAPRAASSQLSQAVLRRLAPPAEPRRTTVDVDRVVALHADPASACVHSSVARPVLPSSTGCLDCLRTGQNWLHLRTCVGCGHVGCCDSSPMRHAAAHAQAQDHPVMVSVESRGGLGLVLPGRADAHPCTLIRVLLAHPSREVAGEARPASGVSST